MTLELVTILDKDGKAQKGKDPNLPPDELKRLYRLMVATRIFSARCLPGNRRQGSCAQRTSWLRTS